MSFAQYQGPADPKLRHSEIEGAARPLPCHAPRAARLPNPRVSWPQATSQSVESAKSSSMPSVRAAQRLHRLRAPSPARPPTPPTRPCPAARAVDTYEHSALPDTLSIGALEPPGADPARDPRVKTAPDGASAAEVARVAAENDAYFRKVYEHKPHFHEW